MYIGVYNACLADKPLGEALDVIKDLGLNSVEINSGGFLPPIHLPVEDLRSSEQARQDYLGEFESRGLTLTALNCNGNPLFPKDGFPHAQDLIESIELGLAPRRQAGRHDVRRPGGRGLAAPIWPGTSCPVEPPPRRARPPVGGRHPVLA